MGMADMRRWSFVIREKYGHSPYLHQRERWWTTQPHNRRKQSCLNTLRCFVVGWFSLIIKTHFFTTCRSHRTEGEIILNSKTIIKIFGIGDILIGTGSILFLLFASYIIPGIKELPLLTSTFFISIAFPLLIVIMGIMNQRSGQTASMLSIFCSFLVMINALATLFAKEPPLFLDENASPTLQFMAHFLVPGFVLFYFSLHLLFTYLDIRGSKKDTPPIKEEPLFQHPEFFCSQCNKALQESDAVCPSCGALIKGLICLRCGYEGSERDFKDNACPRCGEKIEKEA
jgi:DNA-directed RNA polymerase subunit RPC12/RpoP